MSANATAPLNAALHPHGALRLSGWGVIRAQGADAAKFLHGQLTQDFNLLGLGEARLAGYCSPKGRLLATFVGFKLAADDLLLACSADLLAPTLKRLQMFVMRAQCKLSDASADFELWGLAGATATTAHLPATPWAKHTDGPTTWVRLPHALAAPGAEPIPRALAVVPTGQAPAALTSAPALDAATWAWLEVASGVGMVSQPVVDAFVPQMINLESVGGVNFKKGCYPGQEVVARSQYRGTLKRRAFRLHFDGTPADGPLSVGQAVFHSSDAEQPCGTLFSVAPVPGGTSWEALASLQISATTEGTLHAGSANGPTLHLLSLPYTLAEDI
jgi:folate-binding protein YgfZ